jgi:hypothetical protein
MSKRVSEFVTTRVLALRPFLLLRIADYARQFE